jgi:hypothetical protein
MAQAQQPEAKLPPIWQTDVFPALLGDAFIGGTELENGHVVTSMQLLGHILGKMLTNNAKFSRLDLFTDLDKGPLTRGYQVLAQATKATVEAVKNVKDEKKYVTSLLVLVCCVELVFV